MKFRKDYFAGALIAAIGVFAAYQGRSYEIGTLTHMGPGFFPLVLGVLMAIVGTMIAAAAPTTGADAEKPFFDRPPQWRAWGCILAAPILFIVLGRFFGLIPAVFACVFVCAMGDAAARWTNALILAATITLFGVGLFATILHIPFPVLKLP